MNSLQEFLRAILLLESLIINDLYECFYCKKVDIDFRINIKDIEKYYLLRET